jgi:galactokinase/mevalonate kinase-like predicted kinase
VYPNPANTQITIDNGNWSILGGYSIRIVNSAAQEVYNAPISQQTETILLNGWGGNGLYVLYIVDPQQQIVAVKQIVLE